MLLEEIFEVILEAEEYQESFEIEEELECQAEEINRKFQKQLAERRRLFALGLYQLEERLILK